MKQQWWQNQYLWGLSLFGGVLAILQPLFGVLVWPLYRPIQYMTSVLTASDSPYRQVFVNLDLLRSVLIIFFLVALMQYAVHDKQSDLQHRLRDLLVGYVALQVIIWIVPTMTIAEVVKEPYMLTGHDLLLMFVSGFIAILMVKISFLWQTANQPTLTLVWRLSGAMSLVFMLALFIVRALDWPFAGAFDQLSTDAMYMPFIYTSWRFMRLYQK
ncbi:hypothetical protein H9L19_00205 [Weissella diestrammenae]|uniref:DUF998 domain-containing protein n=1 Tax=Weissella diestrammenae TaxID=1162633 RepID=A0A7G9T5J1_9LACO|nr:hypothetical protein [Weissella diestrammenae]MCM0582190.1 hypothetical protein [Weissella diestrammenae]QNN75366.1 hypothetical protein H9L19_00205 [Weissella diestrammenae]